MHILYQDEYVIVTEKPPGIETERFVEQFNIPVDRGGMVHRLDQDTSGLLVIAKKQKALENLKLRFREHTIKKIYTTLIYGVMEQKQGSIEAEIARDPKRKQAMKVISFETGEERGKLREAITKWEVAQAYALNHESRSMKHELKHSTIRNSQFMIRSATLLRVVIHTGRTHQIRVHMQYIGHPILGDKMYNTKESRKVSNLLGLKRQFLHATELGFKHPETGGWVEFRSDLPEDLQKTLDALNHESGIKKEGQKS